MSLTDSMQVTKPYNEPPSSSQQQLLTLETQGFEYTVLTSEVQIIVQSKTSEIKSLMRRNAQDVIDIGQKLTEVKEQLGYGNFRTWLKAEFGWSVRTAARFMQVATQFKCAKLAHLDIATSALYLLAEPSTPEEARKEALELAKEGENITHSKAKVIVNRYLELAQPNVSEPAIIDTINISARATEGHSSTPSEPYSLLQTCCQLEPLEPEDKANSVTATKLLVETVPAKEWGERLEQETVEKIDDLQGEYSEVAAESHPELSNYIHVLSIKYKNLELVTNIAQTFDLTFAGIQVDFEGCPEALLILFKQMQNHPAFAKEVLQQARLLAASITNLN